MSKSTSSGKELLIPNPLLDQKQQQSNNTSHSTQSNQQNNTNVQRQTENPVTDTLPQWLNLSSTDWNFDFESIISSMKAKYNLSTKNVNHPHDNNLPNKLVTNMYETTTSNIKQTFATRFKDVIVPQNPPTSPPTRTIKPKPTQSGNYTLTVPFPNSYHFLPSLNPAQIKQINTWWINLLTQLSNPKLYKERVTAPITPQYNVSTASGYYYGKDGQRRAYYNENKPKTSTTSHKQQSLIEQLSISPATTKASVAMHLPHLYNSFNHLQTGPNPHQTTPKQQKRFSHQSPDSNNIHSKHHILSTPSEQSSSTNTWVQLLYCDFLPPQLLINLHKIKVLRIDYYLTTLIDAANIVATRQYDNVIPFSPNNNINYHDGSSSLSIYVIPRLLGLKNTADTIDISTYYATYHPELTTSLIDNPLDTKNNKGSKNAKGSQRNVSNSEAAVIYTPPFWYVDFLHRLHNYVLELYTYADTVSFDPGHPQRLWNNSRQCAGKGAPMFLTSSLIGRTIRDTLYRNHFTSYDIQSTAYFHYTLPMIYAISFTAFNPKKSNNMLEWGVLLCQNNIKLQYRLLQLCDSTKKYYEFNYFLTIWGDIKQFPTTAYFFSSKNLPLDTFFPNFYNNFYLKYSPTQRLNPNLSYEIRLHNAGIVTIDNNNNNNTIPVTPREDGNVSPLIHNSVKIEKYHKIDDFSRIFYITTDQLLIQMFLYIRIVLHIKGIPTPYLDPINNLIQQYYKSTPQFSLLFKSGTKCSQIDQVNTNTDIVVGFDSARPIQPDSQGPQGDESVPISFFPQDISDFYQYSHIPLQGQCCTSDDQNFQSPPSTFIKGFDTEKTKKFSNFLQEKYSLSLDHVLQKWSLPIIPDYFPVGFDLEFQSVSPPIGSHGQIASCTRNLNASLFQISIGDKIFVLPTCFIDPNHPKHHNISYYGDEQEPQFSQLGNGLCDDNSKQPGNQPKLPFIDRYIIFNAILRTLFNTKQIIIVGIQVKDDVSMACETLNRILNPVTQEHCLLSPPTAKPPSVDVGMGLSGSHGLLNNGSEKKSIKSNFQINILQSQLLQQLLQPIHNILSQSNLLPPRNENTHTKQQLQPDDLQDRHIDGPDDFDNETAININFLLSPISTAIVTYLDPIYVETLGLSRILSYSVPTVPKNKKNRGRRNQHANQYRTEDLNPTFQVQENLQDDWESRPDINSPLHLTNGNANILDLAPVLQSWGLNLSRNLPILEKMSILNNIGENPRPTSPSPSQRQETQPLTDFIIPCDQAQQQLHGLQVDFQLLLTRFSGLSSAELDRLLGTISSRPRTNPFAGQSSVPLKSRWDDEIDNDDDDLNRDSEQESDICSPSIPISPSTQPLSPQYPEPQSIDFTFQNSLAGVVSATWPSLKLFKEPIRCSNWDKFPLSTAQIHYAALDPLVCIEILSYNYTKLIEQLQFFKPQYARFILLSAITPTIPVGSDGYIAKPIDFSSMTQHIMDYVFEEGEEEIIA